MTEGTNGFGSQFGAEGKDYARWLGGPAEGRFSDDPASSLPLHGNPSAHSASPYYQGQKAQTHKEHHAGRRYDGPGPRGYPVSHRMLAPVQPQLPHDQRILQYYTISSQPVKATSKMLRSYLYREQTHLENLERQKKRSNEILKWYILKEQSALQECKTSCPRRSRGYFVSSRRQDSVQVLCLKEKHLIFAADIIEVLAPLRVSAEIEGMMLSDTLTWNVFDTTIDIEKFAYVTCNDLAVPASLFAPVIIKSMRDQIRDFVDYLGPFSQGDLEDLSETTINKKFEKCPELRTVIKLDITIDGYCLLDQFEWDIACSINSPDKFADHMCHELGLPLEFRTAIAHSIREQTTALEKSLCLVGYTFDGSPIVGEEFIDVLLPTVTKQNVFREAQAIEVYGPLYSLINSEAGKVSKDLQRDARRKRRQTCRSRRASTLPHLIFQRTNRTSMGGRKPGSPLLDTTLVSSTTRGYKFPGKRTHTKRQRKPRNTTELLNHSGDLPASHSHRRIPPSASSPSL